MKKRFSILFFSILFTLIFSTFAFADYPSDLPEIPSQFGVTGSVYPTQDYLLSNDNTLWVFNSPYGDEGSFVGNEISYDNRLRVTHSSGKKFAYAVYSLKNGSWSSVAALSNVQEVDTYRHTNSTPVDSSIDLYNLDGELFFTGAVAEELYQTIQKVTEQGLATKLTLAGTIRILVLCGVGLIALLMVLNLFGKLFNRYRS